MRLIDGADAARRTILSRRPAQRSDLPQTMRERLAEVFGEPLTAEQATRRILDDVAAEGDAAVKRYNAAFDGQEDGCLELTSAEREEGAEEVPPELRKALEFAASRIREYHEEQREHAARDFFRAGRGQKVTAIERAGIYVPGTNVVYPSSVLMTAIPARVAGVREILMATSVGAGGRVSPLKLLAAQLAGVDRIFRMSGAQAIAALAFGTQSVPQVDKIYGPGGLFVTIAKRMVYGQVGVDSIYGPSETIVIVDDNADPVLAAADLIAQAEHDELANPILLATSTKVARRILDEVERQLGTLPRADVARTAFKNHGGAAVVGSIEEAIDLANEYAPEHLCLNVEDADRYVGLVRNAGAIFVGEGSPEAIGDYTAGPSHVMPTGRAARFSGALGVHDFLKVTTVVQLDAALAAELAQHGAVIAHAEGFAGHAAAMERRLPEGPDK
ncbi:MAG TPA: histidinol dehydrogenase [Dehalococcoidia bacterium]|nr:histidinol dehydrogenase [Dehalococcoidia bacterium]